ncbi:MAG: hypothetical protein ABI837_06190, partial [Acidobacteriota bacterium]
GPNEGKLMAKFFLDDQYGSVEVVVFSDLYSKYTKWLDNGVAILLTAMVKDTGGMSGGRSASLQSAEQHALQIDDEYGGHPEAGGGPVRISAYEIRDTYGGAGDAGEEDDRDPKEVEREKYGDTSNNLGLFGSAPSAATQAPASLPEDGAVAEVSATPDISEDDAFNEAVAAVAESGAAEPAFAAHAAAFHESPITPELNALEIVPLDGIRDRKVREIALEVRYVDMTDERVRKLREIFEDNPGEIPVSVTIVEVPEAVGGSSLRMKINHHFRVQPGPALTAALAAAHVKPLYVFEKNQHAA